VLIKIQSELFSLLQNKSNYYKDWLILKCINSKNIGILGLSYKVNSKSIKNSPQIHLIQKSKNYFFMFNVRKIKLLNNSYKNLVYGDIKCILQK
jgi:UDP-glucose 6-dehydrogenase